MTDTPYSPAAAVDAGVTVLDQLCPTWRTVINLDDLDLANGESCILGQVGRELLGLEGDDYGPMANTFMVTAAHLAALDGATVNDGQDGRYHVDLDVVRGWSSEHGFSEPRHAYNTYQELQIEWLARLQEENAR